MAFVVEDGTAKADATAATTVAFVDSWAADHPDYAGYTEWQGATETEKQVSIIDATLTAGVKWGALLTGVRYDEDQALDWPRTGAKDWYSRYGVDHDSVPRGWQEAVAVLSMKHRSNPTPGVGNLENSATLKKDSVKIGPISITEEYTGGTDSDIATDDVELVLAESLVRRYTIPADTWIRG